MGLLTRDTFAQCVKLVSWEKDVNKVKKELCVSVFQFILNFFGPLFLCTFREKKSINSHNQFY